MCSDAAASASLSLVLFNFLCVVVVTVDVVVVVVDVVVVVIVVAVVSRLNDFYSFESRLAKNYPAASIRRKKAVKAFEM